MFMQSSRLADSRKTFMMNRNSGLAPVLYLPHGGGPLPLMGEPSNRAITEFLREIPKQLGSPDSILVVSAHWEEPVAKTTAQSAPGLIYDYYGFPPETYEIQYPAPGDPALAARIESLFEVADLAIDRDFDRGFDHGMFVPLKLMYPDANIPCVQLSLVEGLDPDQHIAIGRALASLREQNVLIIGSGMSFHNLRAFANPDRETASRFDDWLKDTCCNPLFDNLERESRLKHWEDAPGARYCHPREEHLIPLHVCFGAAAAGNTHAKIAMNDTVMGAPVSAIIWSQLEGQ